MPRHRRGDPWYGAAKNKVFYVYGYDAETKRTTRESLHTTDPEEARRRFGRHLAEGGKKKAAELPGLTVKKALADYDAEHVALKVVDAVRQRDAMRHLRAYFGEKLFKDVDILESRAYARARSIGDIGGRKAGGGHRKASESTIRRELNVLVAAANHASKWRRLGQGAKPPTPMPEIELPPEPPAERIKWLTKATLRQLFESATGEVQAFALIAYYTAGRRASIEGLTLRQIDLKLGRIHLDKDGARKTKKRRPTVPLYAEIRPTIERLMIAAEARGSERLFEQHFMYRPFVEACAEIGVDAHPHMLRHSRATHMLMDGEDPYKVAKLLGDTLATVERVYGWVSVEYLNTTSNVGEQA